MWLRSLRQPNTDFYWKASVQWLKSLPLFNFRYVGNFVPVFVCTNEPSLGAVHVCVQLFSKTIWYADLATKDSIFTFHLLLLLRAHCAAALVIHGHGLWIHDWLLVYVCTMYVSAHIVVFETLIVLVAKKFVWIMGSARQWTISQTKQKISV